VLSLQAGYGYASSIDPTTQADSGILLILAQMLAGLLFFAVGLDRAVISAFATSLDAHPPGTLLVSTSAAEKVIAAGSGVFSLAARLALPVVGLLLLVDLGLGLLGRISSHIQVISLAFPAKMLLSLLMLGYILVLFPGIYSRHADGLLNVLRSLIAR
jgi:flagellar biosynthetic protein FliR